ncbi:MAG: MMPL family transporter [Bacteroidota bacterium]
MNPVWQAIATFIIRKRIPILIVLGLVTAFMWSKRGTELVQAISQVILTDDPDLEVYKQFTENFGDDGNVLVAALEGDFLSYERFVALYDLTIKIEQLEGVEGVFGLTRLYDVIRNDSISSFELQPLVSRRPESAEEVDSLVVRLKKMAFYDGLLLDEDNNTTLLAVSLNPEMLNTDKKIPMVNSVKAEINKVGERFDTVPKFAGLPVLRVNMHQTVKQELFLFLGLALIVTAFTLLIFFRSLYTVLFPMMVVGSVIIFSLGLIGLFGYKMSLITGVIPALITVISIPNCVYLITKYHIEYRKTKNKLKSLILVIEKIGIVTVMTNATTAVGLGVLAFTDIAPLREFGIVAGLSVVAAFFISLLLIPVVFSFLPPPNENQTKHLDRKSLSVVINLIDWLVMNHRWAVYTMSIMLAGASLYGMTRILPVSYMVDDIPQDSKVLTDLKYIEARFNGALPFEILIDTKQKRGVLKRKTLQNIHKLQNRLAEYEDISRSISVSDFAMFFRQAFFGGNREDYDLPTRNEFNFILDYARKTEFFGELSISKTLTDSSMQITRISASVRDIGSLKMDALVDSVRKDVAEIFDEERYDTAVTGTTQIFIKANEALIENLLRSLLLAFGVIAILMGILFRSGRMVMISLIPNLLPLIMVAGVMGFTGIALKPSTALVFGVAFGIAVDDSIHFLARYRLARKLGDTVTQAVSNSYQDTGVSMIYTSIILFFGFVCFIASDFGGTQALGLLTSMTLGIAMFSNLLLLPALLLTFDQEAPKPPVPGELQVLRADTIVPPPEIPNIKSKEEEV